MRFTHLIQPSLDAFVGDLFLGNVRGNEGVIRQLKFRRRHDRGPVPHRPILGDLNVLDLRDGKHAKILLANGFIEAFAEQLGGQLFLDVFRETAFHQGLRSLSGPVAGNACLALEIACHLRPLLGNLIGGQFDLQCNEAIRLGFNNDVHEQTKQISTANTDTQPAKSLIGARPSLRSA